MREARDETKTDRALALVAGGGADTILSKKQVAAMIGVSVSTLDRMVDRLAFDEPRQLSTRRVGWALSYVQAWIASRPQRAA